jgi:hypothetical protein
MVAVYGIQVSQLNRAHEIQWGLLNSQLGFQITHIHSSRRWVTLRAHWVTLSARWKEQPSHSARVLGR